MMNIILLHQKYSSICCWKESIT